MRRVGRDVRLSRTQAQQWIGGRPGGAWTAEPARRASQTGAGGRRVVVTLPDGRGRASAPEPEDLPLDVLFEDEHLLAVNKPAGVVVHPTYKHASNTVLNAVLWRLRHRPDARPGVLTRLDKDTSGLVLVALSPAVHAARASARPGPDACASSTWRSSRDGRSRAAASSGCRLGAIRATAGAWCVATGRRAERDALRGAVDRRAARRSSGASWSRAARTRSACTWPSSGWPIVGDRVYGTPSDVIARQALHAWRVELPHPVTRERCSAIEAPPPPDIEALVGARGSLERSASGRAPRAAVPGSPPGCVGPEMCSRSWLFSLQMYSSSSMPAARVAVNVTVNGRE